MKEDLQKTYEIYEIMEKKMEEMSEDLEHLHTLKKLIFSSASEENQRIFKMIYDLGKNIGEIESKKQIFDIISAAKK